MKYFTYKLKLIFLLIAFSIFFLGCKSNNDIELRIKKRECTDALIRNRHSAKEIIDLLNKRTSERYKALNSKCIYIDSIREVYTLKKRREYLLVYSDTVINRYRNIDLVDQELLNDWESLRDGILKSDSSDILDFYYLTLIAERKLLTVYSNYISDDSFEKTVTSFMSADRFLLKDTVTLLVRISFFEPIWDFDFSKVTCKSTVTGKELVPHSVKAGPHYIFYYLPHEKGKYLISGNSRYFSYGNWYESELILHQFTVE